MDRPLSKCRRHPTAAPAAGVCPSCLCERLASVDPSATARPVVQIHRSRSYNAAAGAGCRDGVNSNATEPRRKSCDSEGRGAMADRFSSRRESNGLDKEPRPGGRVVRICERRNAEGAPIAREFEGKAELRTMREFIDLERRSKKQAEKECRSIFGVKLRWRRWKGKKRNQEEPLEVGENGLRRRSCEADAAIASRKSVDYPPNSINTIDEPRVSLDGYLLGRTHRVTPLVSVLEDAKIIHSGLDCYEKSNADLDRSDSWKNGAAAMEVLGEVKLKPAAKSKASVDEPEMILYGGGGGGGGGGKLVITEKELMEWDSNSPVTLLVKTGGKEGGSDAAVKSVKLDNKGDVHRSMPVPDCEQWEKSRRWWNIRGLMR